MLQGKNTTIYGNVQFGKNVLLEDNVVIGHPSPAELAGCLDELENYESVEQLYNARSQAPVVIGDNAMIRSGTIIYSGVTIGNNFDCAHGVIIREDCHIGDFVYIKVGTQMLSRCVVGSYCRLAGLIGDNSTIEDHVSSYGLLVHRYARQYTPDMRNDLGPTLHHGCIVGRGAILIGDIHVGENAIVGAATVINFDVPAGSLTVGVKGRIKESKIVHET
jgi:acetyltransferase-like isoleucine patch superfamily enzyme